jgi:putative DNA primase/helicase
MSFLEGFIEAMQAAGIVPPSDLLADGELHRFSSDGSSRKKNGWYVLFGEDPAAGSFGCWKMNITEKWCSRSFKDLDPENRARFKAKMEAAKIAQDEDKARLNAECRAWCIKTWSPKPYTDDDHPYLLMKNVHSYRLKLIGDSLMIPFYDVNGIMHGMQFIRPDGTKILKVGTDKKCHYFPIGKLTDNTLLICEGYATGASLHEATGYSVAVAFDAGNMMSVACVFRSKETAIPL